MEEKAVARLCAEAEEEFASTLPAGLLFAICKAESGNPQSSDLSFSAVAFDPLSRRFEPGFYRRYIQGTSWETRPWGAVPEVSASSYGLAQIMYTTACWARDRGFVSWDVHQFGALFDPRLNLRLAGSVLAYKIRRYGDVASGIAAYNAGSARTMTDGLFENQAYVAKVQAFLVA